MKKIKVGFLGLGVVGSELVNIFLKNLNKLEERYNKNMEIGKIFVRNPDKKRNIDVTGLELTTDADEILNDEDTDIICECIGGSGTKQTRNYIVNAINNGKSVVMSSKKTLALYGYEILNLALENKVFLKFDATVGGGIPVAKILQNCFKGESINKIIGILNATSNFIYTKMEKDNLSFKNALKSAQNLGYAENDPTEDINGYDALYKAVILVLFSMKKWLNLKMLDTVPFSNINVLDMKYADELGYTVKPLAFVKNMKDGLIFRVGPSLIGQNHIAATTSYNNNVIVLNGTNSGPLGFYGQGAGALPTASAMFDDLSGIIALEDNYNAYSSHLYTNIIPEQNINGYTAEKKHSAFYKGSNLYWRIGVENKVGVLARICSIFASNGINIEKLIQKDEIAGKIGVVFLTSGVDSETLNRTIREFKGKNAEINAIIPFLEE